MPQLPEIVYLLCALTSLICVVLLAHGYFRSKARILLWSTLCFIFLALNNFLLFIDLAIVGDRANLSDLRNIAALVAAGLMVFGLVWDSE